MIKNKLRDHFPYHFFCSICNLILDFFATIFLTVATGQLLNAVFIHIEYGWEKYSFV